MTIIINEAGFIKARFYDDNTKLSGNNVIKLPDNVEIDPNKEYAYINNKVIEISYNKDEHKKYFEPDKIDRINMLINESKSYMSSTDYIISKYNELVVITQSISDTDFKIKYKDILDKRNTTRELINNLELELLTIKNSL